MGPFSRPRGHRIAALPKTGTLAPRFRPLSRKRGAPFRIQSFEGETMTSYQAYNFAHAAAARISEEMKSLRQAEKEAATYCNGMAFDGASAEEIYRAALDHFGVPRRDTDGMNAPGLRVLLKMVRTSQASHGAPAMAMDANESCGTQLDMILKGVKPPRDQNRTTLWR
jgi:hypothetical protein